jgi:hypothetical protein
MIIWPGVVAVSALRCRGLPSTGSRRSIVTVNACLKAPNKAAYTAAGSSGSPVPPGRRPGGHLTANRPTAGLVTHLSRVRSLDSDFGPAPAVPGAISADKRVAADVLREGALPPTDWPLDQGFRNRPGAAAHHTGHAERLRTPPSRAVEPADRHPSPCGHPVQSPRGAHR